MHNAGAGFDQAYGEKWGEMMGRNSAALSQYFQRSVDSL